MPLNHITINVSPSGFNTTVSFYQATLAPLGYEMVVFDEGLVALGFDDVLYLFISQNDAMTTRGAHIAFTADSHDIVKLCHEAALKSGAKCNGTPGLRAQYSPTYYAAFVFDPAGNNIEFVCGR